MEEFIINRVYADKAGDSFFEEVKIELKEAGPIGYLSEKYKVQDLIFRQVLPEYDYEFHTAPARQFIILLEGEIEIETSLGEKRTFTAGEVLLVEDTTGKGHKTRNLKTEKRKSIFITLP